MGFSRRNISLWWWHYGEIGSKDVTLAYDDDAKVEGKTLVIKGKTLVTAGKTLVTEGETLVTKRVGAEPYARRRG